MMQFPNDALDPDLCHGDLALQFCANTPDTIIHALRDIVKNMPEFLVLRWMQDGNVPAGGAQSRRHAAERAQLPRLPRRHRPIPIPPTRPLMDRIVWVGAGKGEPDWATGGTYQAVRIIRNFVERWDRTPLESRSRSSGARRRAARRSTAPREHDVPDYAADPDGKMTPLDAHIRLANPRTADERGESHPAPAVQLFERRDEERPDRPGPAVHRLSRRTSRRASSPCRTGSNGEPLEEYIKPVGGGFFFVLPGVPERERLSRPGAGRGHPCHANSHHP